MGQAAVRPNLGKILGIAFSTRDQAINETGHKSTKSDALGKCPLSRPDIVAIFNNTEEYKVELGMNGESGFQCALTVRDSPAFLMFSQVRNVSCYPCILISMAELYLSFVCFISSPYNHSQIIFRQVSKTLSILKDGVEAPETRPFHNGHPQLPLPSAGLQG
ncbi:hypothetical protein BYT27DRAFT_7262765 [Phlegmacium glaucopus]|nr:hypothetical protein BYT27DRAFT_7262765 [Phlegmacium glaucopus]